MRQFETGATRDTDVEKYDYEGFYHPLVIERFGKYMHQHRKQADGNLRDSDNWQKGIPISVYVKSMLRHVITVWKTWRMQHTISEDEACAILFNVQGMLLESIKSRLDASQQDGPVQNDNTGDLPRLYTPDNCSDNGAQVPWGDFKSYADWVHSLPPGGKRIPPEGSQADRFPVG